MKKYLILCFIVTALAQLYVPAHMIFGRELVISRGTTYKFRLAPIDPSDPFRGKYINLYFKDNTCAIPPNFTVDFGQEVYATVAPDSAGYARIVSVSKEKPENTNDYFVAKVGYGDAEMLNLDFPFTRYYMEESKSYDAELAYRESSIDTTQVTYGLVSISKGDAVLTDVMINDESIKDIVKNRQQEYRKDNE
jgi:uncharacterized membrane-anchored protein